jgi:hypothetical protein
MPPFNLHCCKSKITQLLLQHITRQLPAYCTPVYNLLPPPAHCSVLSALSAPVQHRYKSFNRMQSLLWKDTPTLELCQEIGHRFPAEPIWCKQSLGQHGAAAAWQTWQQYHTCSPIAQHIHPTALCSSASPPRMTSKKPSAMPNMSPMARQSTRSSTRPTPAGHHSPHQHRKGSQTGGNMYHKLLNP